MKIHLAVPEEWEAARDFYYDLVDRMPRELTYYPDWEKGVHPSEEEIRTAAREGALFLGTEQGQIIGAMLLDHTFHPAYTTVPWGVEAPESEVLSLHLLGVLPSCQSRGYGTQFLDFAKSYAAATGQKAIRLDVLEWLLPPQRLYERSGFQKRAALQMYYPSAGLTTFLLYEYVMPTSFTK